MEKLTELIGQTITDIKLEGANKEGEQATKVVFVCKDARFEMYHDQDCCEFVRLEEIVGDLDILLNSPVLNAYESSNSGEDGYESYTWTFYHISTVKGSVTLRWLGESNGYYSEHVNFQKVEKTIS